MNYLSNGNFTLFIYIMESEFGTKPIPQTMLYNFNLKASLYYPYLFCDISLANAGGFLFKNVGLGTLVKIVLGSPCVEGTDVLQSNATKYETYFRVIKYDKSPFETGESGSYCHMSLISSFYFSDISSDTCIGRYGYVDNIIGETLEEVLSKDNKDKSSRYRFVNDSTPSSLNTSIWRYQVGRTNMEFIDDLLSYGFDSGKRPLYLFPRLNGEVVLKGLTDMFSTVGETALKFGIILNPNSNEYSKELMEYLERPFDLTMLTYNFVSNGSDVASDVKFLYMNPRFSNSGSTSSLTGTVGFSNNFSVTFPSIQKGNPMTIKTTPGKTMYGNWYTTPSDAYAQAARYMFDTNLSTYYLVSTCNGFPVDKVKLGKKVFFDFPDFITNETSDGNNTLGDGYYIISSFELTTSSRDVPKTKVTLSQVTS